MIILEMLVIAVSNYPKAIFFKRRLISLNTRSNKEVVFGAMTSVFSQSSSQLMHKILQA